MHELAATLQKFYRGRRDAYAIRGREGYYPARKQDQDLPLSEEVYAKHLNGGPNIGVYLMSPGKSNPTVYFAVFDLDDHGNEAGWDEVARVAKILTERLGRLGYRVSVFRSTGGRGIHIALFWESPQFASLVRSMMQGVSADLQSSPVGIEVFPKQDHVDEGDYGNLIALPFSGESCLLDENLKPVPSDHWEPEYSGCVPITEGCRNNALASYAGWVHRERPDADLLEALLEHDEAFCDPPLGEKACRNIAKSIGKKPQPEFTGTPIDKRGLLETLNKRHATLWDGPKLRILHQTYDSFARRDDVSMADLHHLKSFYRNHPPVATDVNGKTKLLNQIEWWMEQPGRRHCKGFVLDPLNTDPDVYNLWEGWAVQPNPNGKCDLYLAHIHDNIASGAEKIYEYLLDWMADAIQNPTVRPGVAVVLRGGQGTGKGVYISSFGKLFGRHFVHVKSPDQFLGRFNKHLQYALLVFADEAVWGGDKKAEGRLKGLITEPDVLIEAKFVDARPMPNLLRFMIASNNQWVIPAGLDERRMFMLDVGEDKKQDAEYFKAILEQLRNGGYGKLLHMLQARDLSNANLRKFPMTKALLEQKIASMPSEIRFLYEIARDGVVPGDYGGEARTTKKAFYKRYVEYARESGVTHRPSQEQLSISLSKIIPLRTIKPHKGGRQYQFPPLQAVREKLAEKLQQEIDWPEQDVWDKEPIPYADEEM